MSDDELRTELATLMKLVENLQAQLDSARLVRAPTMRQRLHCPGCGASRIAHATRVLDRGDGDSREALALNQPSWWSGEVIGELEAYACTACGLVEWFVKDPGALREVKDQLVILDGESPEAGPYR